MPVNTGVFRMKTFHISLFSCKSKNKLKKNFNSACVYPVLVVYVLFVVSTPARSEEVFNPAFLSDDPDAVADLSRFEKGEGQAAGTYLVDIYLNDDLVSSQNITFSAKEETTASIHAPNDDSGLTACITPAMLDKFNVNIKSFQGSVKASLDECINLSEFIPQATSVYDFENQRLDISIPQAALKNDARGNIDPKEWDQGIPAILLNYNFSGSNSRTIKQKTTANGYFLNLNSGMNLGAWRLRNYSTWNYSTGISDVNQWRNTSTYLQRNIIRLKSNLVIGDSYASGDIFDSVGMRGVTLASDDNMLPDSLRGFAPTVRGVAKSHAKVTIRQNSYVIYQTYVSPGAFEINDLYPTSSSGDLEVTITESDGSENVLTVPYSTVPILQREGHLKYALHAGQYRTGSGQQNNPFFGQGTLMWGLPAGMTLYGGSQLASRYQAFSLGFGKNLGDWGAASIDVTHANSKLVDDSQHQGQSLRFLYAKSLNNLGTNFQLVGYRYSTEGFYTLDDTSYRRMSDHSENNPGDTDPTKPIRENYHNLNFTRKGRIQVSISQQLGDLGAIYLSGSRQTYWHSSQSDDLLQVGFNGMLKDVSYGLAFSYNRNPGLDNGDKRVALNMSVPLAKLFSPTGAVGNNSGSGNSAYASYSANTDNRGAVTQQAGLSGTLLDGQNLNYSVQQGYGNQGEGGNGSASLSYQGGYGNSNIAYNYSKDYQQVSYGMSGGIVAHSEGITLSQPLGDANVLVSAPGAAGVDIENYTGVSTDWRGYAVIPYATTYRRNRVALDINTLKENTDVDSNVGSVIPTQGALVRASFSTRIGARALLILKQINGKSVPFGAAVSREDSGDGSIVGDGGQVYLAGLPLQGVLNVKWGNLSHQQCVAPYILPADSENKVISYLQVSCK